MNRRDGKRERQTQLTRVNGPPCLGSHTPSEDRSSAYLSMTRTLNRLSCLIVLLPPRNSLAAKGDNQVVATQVQAQAIETYQVSETHKVSTANLQFVGFDVFHYRMYR